MPCWLVGRFYPKDKFSFQLKSQNLSIDCQSEKMRSESLSKGATFNIQKPINCRNKDVGNERSKMPSAKAINCQRIESMFEIPRGAWLAVHIQSKKQDKYLVSDCKILKAPSKTFKEVECSYKNKGEVLQNWDQFLSAVKDFFYSKGCASAKTPSLVSCPGTEPHLAVFKTSLCLNNKFKDIYLPTSPEMHLKKLLSQDWTDFFEIKTCYRNGELGPLHQPEFTLLEWYRAFYTTAELMQETYQLLCFLKTKSFFKAPLPKMQAFSLEELFKKYLNFSLKPETSKEELCPLLKKHKLTYPEKAGFEDLFFLLFLNRIEPKLPKEAPVFIYNYPPSLRAFSKINQEGWADRFELYWKGMELANAFYEVTDSKEQLALFKKHIAEREDSLPLDQELISYMQGGMPPSSGIAMGLDRLFLALSHKKDLKEIRLFPLTEKEDI